MDQTRADEGFRWEIIIPLPASDSLVWSSHCEILNPELQSCSSSLYSHWPKTKQMFGKGEMFYIKYQ